MGGSVYSDDLYKARATARLSTRGSASAFIHDDDIKAGKAAAGIHADLNPKGVKVRESRDSDVHPESLAIIVGLDVTGSMGVLPRAIQAKLSTLMSALMTRGHVAHPQVLFAAIGDAYSDSAPLQVGQFESGLEMEDVLGKFYIESGGGGQHCETYEFLHYFAAHHTAIDCFEKRGVKGYLFTLGDEAPYDVIRKSAVANVIGDTLQSDVATKDVFEACAEKYHIFHIVIEEGSYKDDPKIEKAWRDLLGERVLKCYDHTNIAELIASTIALTEGVEMAEALAALKDAGASDAAVNSVSSALATYKPETAVAVGGASGLEPVMAAGLE